MDKGTIAAVVPIEVPAISLVTGISATRRMMKGTERKPLTMAPRMRFTQSCSAMPPRPVATSASPRGSPATREIAPDAAVITMVSQRERRKSSIITGDMAQHLRTSSPALQKADRTGHIAGRNGEKECGERLSLHMIHAALDEPEAG